jgi:hypothetical protein
LGQAEGGDAVGFALGPHALHAASQTCSTRMSIRRPFNAAKPAK